MKLYRIEFWSEHCSKWMLFGTFSHMRKTSAEGAWFMLESMNPLGQYRLYCETTEQEVETFKHFTVQAN